MPAESIVMAGVMPHPPVVVPAVGGSDALQVARTARAMTELAGRVRAAAPGTLVVIGPHGRNFADAVAVHASTAFRGDLASFGAAGTEQVWDGHPELARAIAAEAGVRGIMALPLDEKAARAYDHGARAHGHGARVAADAAGRGDHAEALDHGQSVPLHFLRAAGVTARLVPVGMATLPYPTLYAFGEAVWAACERLGERVAVIASGDLSHRLAPGAPAGYDPRGKDFDAQVVEAVRAADPVRLADLDPELVEAAGECGLRPIIMMLGALEGLAVEAEVLSYEGPFGVGYLVASLRPTGGSDQARGFADVLRHGRVRPAGNGRRSEHPLVALARRTIEAHVRTGRRPSRLEAGEERQAPEMKGPPAGVFVSLKLDGRLRGCIGTIEPTTGSVAEEVIQNAVSAAARDPRFPPVREEELDRLAVSVDVLGAAEPVAGEGELDVRRYGVIVRKGRRSGLLLPDLEGVDTVAEQVAIARRKAGIGPEETGVQLYRFEVFRYK